MLSTALKRRPAAGENVLMACIRVLLLPAIVLLLLTFVAAASADAPTDADWSTRLLQQKALVERAQHALDEHTAAYAKAVAGGESADRVEALKQERDAAAAALAEHERALPRLVGEAREAGVSEQVLVPYRYAAPPSPNGTPAATP